MAKLVTVVLQAAVATGVSWTISSTPTAAAAVHTVTGCLQDRLQILAYTADMACPAGHVVEEH